MGWETAEIERFVEVAKLNTRFMGKDLLHSIKRVLV